MDLELPPGKYRHYKGGEYELIFVAEHTESREELVIYRSLEGSKKTQIWARPKKMFLETVETKEGRVLRFERI